MEKMNTSFVYYSHLHINPYSLYIAATTQGICYISSNHGNFQEVEQWVKKHIPNAQIILDNEFLQIYFEQLKEYFNQKRTVFDVPLDLRGTTFQRDVWNVLKEIPFGEMNTYSEIAEYIGKPTATRAVASAIGQNPVMIIVPCHRVIRKDGSLSGFRGGTDMKRLLQQLESDVINK